MEYLDLKVAIEWSGTILNLIVGTTSIVLGFSKWFGDRLAEKLLKKDGSKNR
jgi:hypothetical protein